jgi:hypothetical protein
MRILGHKNIKNTLLYTQLVSFDASEEYVCKIAQTPTEIQALIEDGFEYTCDLNEMKFFRKRK